MVEMCILTPADGISRLSPITASAIPWYHCKSPPRQIFHYLLVSSHSEDIFLFFFETEKSPNNRARARYSLLPKTMTSIDIDVAFNI